MSSLPALHLTVSTFCWMSAILSWVRLRSCPCSSIRPIILSYSASKSGQQQVESYNGYLAQRIFFWLEMEPHCRGGSGYTC